MGEWREKDGHYELVCATRHPQEILNEMKTCRDPKRALWLCQEFPVALNDHEMCLYAP